MYGWMEFEENHKVRATIIINENMEFRPNYLTKQSKSRANILNH